MREGAGNGWLHWPCRDSILLLVWFRKRAKLQNLDVSSGTKVITRVSSCGYDQQRKITVFNWPHDSLEFKTDCDRDGNSFSSFRKRTSVGGWMETVSRHLWSVLRAICLSQYSKRELNGTRRKDSSRGSKRPTEFPSLSLSEWNNALSLDTACCVGCHKNVICLRLHSSFPCEWVSVRDLSIWSVGRSAFLPSRHRKGGHLIVIGMLTSIMALWK